MPRHRRILPVAAAFAVLSLSGCAALGLGGGEDEPDIGGLGPDATATLRTPEGRVVGQVDISDTPQNAVVIRATLYGGVLSPGTHAFHIHQTGRCTPDFTAAGGHFAPDGHAHGIMVEDGKHAGDLPNVHLGNSGRTEFELFAQGLTTRAGAEGSLFDSDGSAVLIHAGADDYRSQPSGAAGDRVACGEIQRR